MIDRQATYRSRDKLGLLYFRIDRMPTRLFDAGNDPVNAFQGERFVAT